MLISNRLFLCFELAARVRDRLFLFPLPRAQGREWGQTRGIVSDDYLELTNGGLAVTSFSPGSLGWSV